MTYGDGKEAVYTVSNIDDDPPEMGINNNPVKIENGDVIGYVKLLYATDDLSGVKVVKYDYGAYYEDEIDIKEHFDSNGYDVEDENIYIKSGYSKITAYVEDNAGNYDTVIFDVNI